VPDANWLRLLLLGWLILVGAVVPLAVLTPVRRRLGKPVKRMWVRYAAWFGIAAVLTVPVCLGAGWALAALLVVSLAAFEEYIRSVGLWRERPHVWLGRACIVLVHLPAFLAWQGLFAAMPAYLILLILVFPILRDTYRGMIQRSCLTLLGVLYFGWFVAHAALLVNATEGRALLLAFLLIVTVHDAAAALVGSTFGRRPLAPNLRPEKTEEGALVGVAASVGMTVLVRFALPDVTFPDAVLLGFLVGVGATCGDLVLSLIRRDVQLEDPTTLIPGHGRLLDRLDSVIFAAPIFFHFLHYFYDLGLGR
jgi:phosphatidate cytidylyltransferase